MEENDINMDRVIPGVSGATVENIISCESSAAHDSSESSTALDNSDTDSTCSWAVVDKEGHLVENSREGSAEDVDKESLSSLDTDGFSVISEDTHSDPQHVIEDHHSDPQRVIEDHHSDLQSSEQEDKVSTLSWDGYQQMDGYEQMDHQLSLPTLHHDRTLDQDVCYMKKYVHHPNKRLNMLLNFLMILSVTAVLGLGIGNFLGWSSFVVQQQAQKEKLHSLESDLVTCITGEEGQGRDDQDLDDRVIKQLWNDNLNLQHQLEILKKGSSSFNLAGKKIDPSRTEKEILLKERVNQLLNENGDLQQEVARLRYIHLTQTGYTSIIQRNELNQLITENQDLRLQIAKFRYGQSFPLAEELEAPHHVIAEKNRWSDMDIFGSSVGNGEKKPDGSTRLQLEVLKMEINALKKSLDAKKQEIKSCYSISKGDRNAENTDEAGTMFPSQRKKDGEMSSFQEFFTYIGDSMLISSITDTIDKLNLDAGNKTLRKFLETNVNALQGYLGNIYQMFVFCNSSQLITQSRVKEMQDGLWQKWKTFIQSEEIQSLWPASSIPKSEELGQTAHAVPQTEKFYHPSLTYSQPSEKTQRKIPVTSHTKTVIEDFMNMNSETHCSGTHEQGLLKDGVEILKEDAEDVKLHLEITPVISIHKDNKMTPEEVRKETAKYQQEQREETDSFQEEEGVETAKYWKDTRDMFISIEEERKGKSIFQEGMNEKTVDFEEKSKEKVSKFQRETTDDKFTSQEKKINEKSIFKDFFSYLSDVLNNSSITDAAGHLNLSAGSDVLLSLQEHLESVMSTSSEGMLNNTVNLMWDMQDSLGHKWKELKNFMQSKEAQKHVDHSIKTASKMGKTFVKALWKMKNFGQNLVTDNKPFAKISKKFLKKWNHIREKLEGKWSDIKERWDAKTTKYENEMLVHHELHKASAFASSDSSQEKMASVSEHEMSLDLEKKWTEEENKMKGRWGEVKEEYSSFVYDTASVIEKKEKDIKLRRNKSKKFDRNERKYKIKNEDNYKMKKEKNENLYKNEKHVIETGGSEIYYSALDVGGRYGQIRKQDALDSSKHDKENCEKKKKNHWDKTFENREKKIISQKAEWERSIPNKSKMEYSVHNENQERIEANIKKDEVIVKKDKKREFHSNKDRSTPDKRGDEKKNKEANFRKMEGRNDGKKKEEFQKWKKKYKNKKEKENYWSDIKKREKKQKNRKNANYEKKQESLGFDKRKKQHSGKEISMWNGVREQEENDEKQRCTDDKKKEKNCEKERKRHAEKEQEEYEKKGLIDAKEKNCRKETDRQDDDGKQREHCGEKSWTDGKEKEKVYKKEGSRQDDNREQEGRSARKRWTDGKEKNYGKEIDKQDDDREQGKHFREKVWTDCKEKEKKYEKEIDRQKDWVEQREHYGKKQWTDGKGNEKNYVKERNRQDDHKEQRELYGKKWWGDGKEKSSRKRINRQYDDRKKKHNYEKNRWNDDKEKKEQEREKFNKDRKKKNNYEVETKEWNEDIKMKENCKKRTEEWNENKEMEDIYEKEIEEWNRNNEKKRKEQLAIDKKKNDFVIERLTEETEYNREEEQIENDERVKKNRMSKDGEKLIVKWEKQNNNKTNLTGSWIFKRAKGREDQRAEIEHKDWYFYWASEREYRRKQQQRAEWYFNRAERARAEWYFTRAGYKRAEWYFQRASDRLKHERNEFHLETELPYEEHGDGDIV